MEIKMAESKRVLPTGGGSKGGTRFPRIPLKKAHEYAKKLVSKTHTGPQSSDVILPGVFGTAGLQVKLEPLHSNSSNYLMELPKLIAQVNLPKTYAHQLQKILEIA